ncbi:hypothetical protein ACGFMK_13375 [Amycolatopsis sp. NPDC049252]|uniref:hypothetical protein n=1 Tax=Amycolatopsis sp. NPDC049252 TaxID=3363933 RepID=UPI003717D764
MGVFEAIEVLAEDWPGIEPLLGDQAGAIRAAADRFLSEPSVDGMIPEAVELCDLVGDLLPPDHRFRAALAADGVVRLHSPNLDPRSRNKVIRSAASLRLSLVGAPRPEETHRQATRWLLAAKSLQDHQVRARGADPADPDLLSLVTDGGKRQWPVFQFGPRTDLVRRINRILDVADDPWGVADWWLGRHAWLADVPAMLIGEVPDQVLIDAAEAERAEA